MGNCFCKVTTTRNGQTKTKTFGKAKKKEPPVNPAPNDSNPSASGSMDPVIEL